VIDRHEPRRPPADRWTPTTGILAGSVDAPRTRRSRPVREVALVPGLVVEHRASGFCGAVVRLERGGVVLCGRGDVERVFRLEPAGFLVEGDAATLVAPTRSVAPGRTASGSIPVAGARAVVAQPSRIWVEGVHDAELVERVWGDDLRIVGVAVERLDGIDALAEAVRRFAPGPARRLGVLVDHLVPGSKEARLAASVTSPDVLVAGTPYVDVWQAVRPKVLGIAAWPEIPRGVPWKEGVCAALGWGASRDAWRRILGSVRTYADLEPALVGAVERLIDFVTAPPE
jgi:hypothetical protein